MPAGDNFISFCAFYLKMLVNVINFITLKFFTRLVEWIQHAIHNRVAAISSFEQTKLYRDNLTRPNESTVADGKWRIQLFHESMKLPTR